MFETTTTAWMGRTVPPPIEPEDLVDEVDAELRLRDRVEARIVSLLAAVGESRAYEWDGYSSMTAMLKHRMSLHPGEALRLVTRANGLRDASVVAAGYRDGRLTGAQVDVLLEARSMAPEPFARDEGKLVAQAQVTPLIRDLRKSVDYWLDQVAGDQLAGSRELVREARSLTLRRDGEMVRLNGWYDIESGEALRALLEPGPPAEEDTRSAPARRADTLLDILNGSSKRPHLIVHVDTGTLTGGSPDISETSYGTFLTSDEITRLACDSSLNRVIFGPDSLPLDVGRTRRLVPDWLRAAVCARDMGCVFPGCDRPPQWCDAHHIQHWVDRGETCLSNLILLCRHHHTLVHEGRWKITGQPGQLRFWRPDGTELGTKRPQRKPPRLVPVPSPEPLTAEKHLNSLKTLPRLRGP